MLGRSLLLAATVAVAVGACTSESSTPAHIGLADAYTAVIRWHMAAGPATEGDAFPIVYVSKTDGKAIKAAAQAAVTAELLDEATVRFADDADDAIDNDVDDEPVLGDGVLLVVEGITDDLGARAEIEVRVYRHRDDDRTWLVTLASSSTGAVVRSSVEQPQR